MQLICVVLLGLVAMAAAHWKGYPFKTQNEGKYGAAHPYANYGNKVKEVKHEPKVFNAGYGHHGQAVAGYGYPNAYYGGYNYGHNHEFDYRRYGGYPVHVGAGQFRFLGSYGGHCHTGYDYGLYFSDDKASFVVCDHGRSHRFACPKGTQNRDHAHFKQGHAYGMSELCGVNNYDKTTH